ncbi:N-acetylmuramoyl-L-alanine amidase [Arenibacter sp. GZD96]|uniref:N-acetylmuramoyl-L-alanine amidase family protein n=1 Tax=Aurantibrevibacter litoralis TaxID=3106030 RepID=UPI002B003393|nr:N-acetylmuramoyl-L-alanine amidase [Arenibacter sp. GZD-96]MEA1787400.1 N-acetylmuramoyl-L-alanine amidase [Arenibacter sp. GZD-96]
MKIIEEVGINIKVKYLMLPMLTLLLFLLPSFSAVKKDVGNDDKFVVVLDAGHGGHDPGNLGNGYLEKNIALNIVLKVGEILSKNPDIQVVYTRKDDTFVDLYKRGEIANKANADLFISVHCDSHNSDAHGAGTFVLGLHANKQNFEIAKKENSVIYLEDNYDTRYAAYDINSPESVIGLTIMQEEFLDQSILLAKMMQDNFAAELKRNDRKVKQAGFIVLHQTFMPSVLVETGFLTNKEEGAYLNSKKGQAEMGEAIAKAVLKYKADLVGNTATTTTPKQDVPVAEKEVAASTGAGTGTSRAVTPAITQEVPKKSVPEGEFPKKDKTETVTQGTTPEVTKKEELKTPVVEDKKEVAVIASSEKKDPMPAVVEKNVPAVKENVVFKVQLMASSKDLPLRSEDFKGLNKLSKEPINDLFRYMYGNTSSYTEAKLLKTNADAKGYTTSYIVAYKDGVRIPLQEALKYVSE